MTTINMCNYLKCLPVSWLVSFCLLLKFLYIVLYILYVNVLHLLYDFFPNKLLKNNHLNGSRTTVLVESSMCLCGCITLPSRYILSIQNIPTLHGQHPSSSRSYLLVIPLMECNFLQTRISWKHLISAESPCHLDHDPVPQNSTVIEYSTMITFCYNRQGWSNNLKMQVFFFFFPLDKSSGETH